MTYRSSISTEAFVSLLMLVVLFGTLPRFEKVRGFTPVQQDISAPSAPSNSLAQILNPDGTLYRSNGVNGSFDPKGYRMEYTPSGAPRFAPEVAPDDFWDPQFGKNGVGDEVTAMEKYGSNVYAAVCFGGPCGVFKWDGNTWSQLGTTFTNGVIHAIAVDEPNVTIGGEFTTIGAVSANYIARWNGSAWFPLGQGTSDYVYTLSSFGGPAFTVGGRFDSAGGVPGTSRVAFWAAGSWNAIANGLPTNNVIYASEQATFPSPLYVGGFNTAQNRGIIWKWNGAGSWSEVPGNFDVAVRSLASDDTDVYAGGFNNVNGIPGTKGIAKWNGSSWFSVGGGMDSPNVLRIRVGNGAIYAGGSFAMAGTRLVNNVARWDGTAWSELGLGTNGPVEAIAFPAIGSGVYVGGNFTVAGGNSMNHVAKFDTSWSPLRSSLNGDVYAVAVFGNDVYVGGSFTSANGVPHTAYLAKWNGTQWSSVGGIDFNGAVNAFAVNGNKLYVGGAFTNLGPYFVFWNGNNWSVVCSGSLQGGQVLSLAVSNVFVPERVFVGGTFASANGIPGTNFLASCYDSAWFQVGGGVNSVVNSMVAVGYDVYMGGAFTSAGGVPGTNRIARWDENGYGAWYAVGSGANNTIVSLAKDVEGNIYAGGAFTSMDGVANTLHIAKWNGSAWSALGTGINGNVWSVSVGRGIVYAGGQFSNAGGHAANNVAAFKNGTWSGLGSGTNAIVRAVTQRAKSVYVGGSFFIAGGKPSYFFGRYRLVDSTPFDFDGDNRSDVSIFRPSPAEWWISRSGDGGNNAYQFGASSDRIAPVDFTGDGKTDVALWRPSTGEWYIIRSENSTFYGFPFGTNGDIPMPADYDGDTFADPAIFRPSTSTWYIPMSSNGGAVMTTQFGSAGDKPVAADYDGDSKADIAIFRPTGGSGAAEWWILRSSGGVYATPFGNSADRTVQGDWTGDGKTDIAIWRPSTGQWFVVRSEDSSFYGFPFGTNGDVPVPGDYDGDGKFDAAVFRQPGAQWFIGQSSGGTTIRGFGIAGDVPLESAYVR